MHNHLLRKHGFVLKYYHYNVISVYFYKFVSFFKTIYMTHSLGLREWVFPLLPSAIRVIYFPFIEWIVHLQLVTFASISVQYKIFADVEYLNVYKRKNTCLYLCVIKQSFLLLFCAFQWRDMYYDISYNDLKRIETSSMRASWSKCQINFEMRDVPTFFFPAEKKEKKDLRMSVVSTLIWHRSYGRYFYVGNKSEYTICNNVFYKLRRKMPVILLHLCIEISRLRYERADGIRRSGGGNH